MVTPQDKSLEDNTTHLITAKCKTISGKSTLTYHLGKDDKRNASIKIHSNTNNGYFSAEWLKLSDILAILEKHGSASFTSFILQALYRGRSVNTPAFLISALLNEKVIKLEEGKSRKYLFLSPNALLAKIEKAETAKAAKPPRKKAAAKTARKPSTRSK